MKTHELKTWPEYFDQIKAGLKTFECRKHDRDFNVGDVLRLREFEPMREIIAAPDSGYTGRVLEVSVTYTLAGPDFGIGEGWLVMAIVPVAVPSIATVWNVAASGVFTGNCGVRILTASASFHGKDPFKVMLSDLPPLSWLKKQKHIGKKSIWVYEKIMKEHGFFNKL